MSVKNDILELIRAVFTVIIYALAVVVTGIISTPFLGYGEIYHRTLVKQGAATFVIQRLVILVTILLLTFSLLYLLGWLCKRKIGKHTYLIFGITLLIINIGLTVMFLNDFLWNYKPV